MIGMRKYVYTTVDPTSLFKIKKDLKKDIMKNLNQLVLKFEIVQFLKI